MHSLLWGDGKYCTTDPPEALGPKHRSSHHQGPPEQHPHWCRTSGLCTPHTPASCKGEIRKTRTVCTGKILLAIRTVCTGKILLAIT